MPLLRIEAVKDETTGRYLVEIYYPADSDAPFVTTQPRYQSASAAETDTIAILASGANRERTE